VERSGEPEPGIPLYADFVKDELAAQDARKASFEQRGITVITTSGVLVTLLLGLAALSTKKADTFVLPAGADDALSIALVLFVAAAVSALLGNVPLKYDAVRPEDVKARLKEEDPRDAAQAAKDIGLTRLNALTDAKRKNTWKGWLLIAALSFEIVAVGFVAYGVQEVLTA
jgi:hypothetical protein